MIHDMSGDIFEQYTDAIVCPVNCVGVMGAGPALEFKNRNPSLFRYYQMVCKNGDMKLGKAVWAAPYVDCFRYIVLFPTKDHWKDASRPEDVKNGLSNLVFALHATDFKSISIPALGLHATDFKSISIPALGCGLGGLDWTEVRPAIVRAFESLPNVDVYLFGPQTKKGNSNA